jgi:hypothetical protein
MMMRKGIGEQPRLSARGKLARRAEERIRALEPRQGAIGPVSMEEGEPELPYVPYAHEEIESGEEKGETGGEREEERKRREVIGEICGLIVGKRRNDTVTG